jgi:hypothetical protein
MEIAKKSFKKCSPDWRIIKKEPSSVKKPTKKKAAAIVKDDLSMPVWLQATRSFYLKLNRVATECGLSRYDTLTRGLDALLRETSKQQSPLTKKIKSEGQRESFRKTMGEVSRKYWATLTPEEKRARAQKSANARWSQREKAEGND